jgi:hypothetical protein
LYLSLQSVSGTGSSHFVFNDANDGTEDVFIAPLAATPERSSLLFAASGLFLLALPFVQQHPSKVGGKGLTASA